jgi:hypothetical protein
VRTNLMDTTRYKAENNEICKFKKKLKKILETVKVKKKEKKRKKFYSECH